MARPATADISPLTRLLALWSAYRPMMELRHRLDSGDGAVSVAGLSGSSPAFMLADLVGRSDRTMLAVTENAEGAVDLYDDLSSLLGDDLVAHYPSRQILPYDFRAPVGEILGRRIATLAGLLDRKVRVVVAPIRAIMEPTIPPAQLEAGRISLAAETETDMDSLARKLVELGFRRVPSVEEVGDFAVRGGLIDFFSPGDEAPIRVEFFGDQVETIRRFDVGSQRTIEQISRVAILPRREIPVTEETLERHLRALPEADADYIRSRYLNDPELPGLEWLALLFGIEQARMTDYLTGPVWCYFDGAGAIRTEMDSIIAEAGHLYERFKNRLERLPAPDAYYPDPDLLWADLGRFHTIDRTPFKGGRTDGIDFVCGPHPAFGARLDFLGKAVGEYATTGVAYFVATDSDIQKQRLATLFADKKEIPGSVVLDVVNLKGGFVSPSGRFAVLTDHEIFGRFHRTGRRKKFREGVAISDYSSLTRGDFVVHTDHGIARYLGLETLTVDNRQRDCLLLQYEGDDKLYVPIEEFNRVSKYSGKDGAPQLTRLGGVAWERITTKTKKAIADMAADLLKLYADRKSNPGYSFGEDSVWLQQLEAQFPYDETPDQLKAIHDVKRDMAESRPMDRLICGDVGYGKTEVAIRAAFKAIEAEKQVAVLVPTTILAQQHFHTFAERFREYPLRVEVLSRFRTRAEQLETVERLAEGKVDLVVGTHRLLSKDVRFRDLGLLIIDEEHRFGVRHKEKLRQLKTTVDTMSLTATPIPRTLQMSLMGTRDMSLITTSPKDRLPIITEIVEFDPAVIATAILREINRGGQVFFVHNRVQTIEAMHRYLKRILPQAEVAVAHGQMHEKSLEGVMLAFLAKRYNVLLCTAIIESGLDIPSANTIIINRADRFGLAQLYQLRGRVGRSTQRAYAYLLTPPTRLLSADAIKRLRALEAHSDLGSGFALAMRDLEIRGAGTILGARQSGYIEEVGYDLYNRLLEEAIADLRGQAIQRPPETKLEVDLELVLPASYVADRQHKVDIYRRLADAANLDQVERLRDEVVDRFGAMVPPARDLFDAAAVKVAAGVLEIEKLKMRKGRVSLFFKEGRRLSRDDVQALGKATSCPMEFSIVDRTQIHIDMTAIPARDRLVHLRGILGSL